MIELLTTTEAAAILRLSRSRVTQLCASGEIPAHRRGTGHFRIDKAKLLEQYAPTGEQAVFEKPLLTVPDVSIFDRIDRLTKPT